MMPHDGSQDHSTGMTKSLKSRRPRLGRWSATSMEVWSLIDCLELNWSFSSELFLDMHLSSSLSPETG